MLKILFYFSFFLILNLHAVDKVKAVIPKNFPPYYIINEKNQPDGFAIEILNTIAKKNNLEVEYIVKDSFNEVNKYFSEKKADIIPNIGISPERKEYVLFTNTTDSFKIIPFKRYSDEIASINEIEKQKVIVVKGNIGLKLMKDHPKELLIIKENNKDAIFSLLSAEGDILVYPETPIIKILNQLNLEDKIVPLDNVLKEIKRAIGVQKDNPELLKKLNSGLEKIKESGEFETIFTKWHTEHEIIKLKKSDINKFFITTIIIIGSLLISLLLLFRSIKLKKLLISQKSKFQNLFENHNSVMLLIEPKSGKIVDANKSAIKFYGYSKKELLNLNISVINLLPKKEHKEKRNDAFNNKINKFIFPHKLKDGTIRTVEVHSSPIDTDQGKVLFSIIEDITEKISFEKKINKQNEELITLKNSLDTAVKAATLGIWEWDIKSNSINWNDIAYEIYGIKKDTFLDSKLIESLIYEDDIELYNKTIKKSLIEKSTFNFEYKITKDSIVRTLLVIGSPIIKDNKVIKFTGIVQDITNTKKREKELLDAQEISKIGDYDFDIKNNKFTTSKILDNTFGIPKGYEKTFESWIALIHEEDKKMMADYFTSIIENKKEFDKEYRIRDYKTNKIKWIHGLGVVVYNDKNEPYRMFGTIQDITSRKEYESQMQQAMTVFENTNEGIMITNSNNEIVNVNPAFTETTGYSFDDVRGENPSILKSNMTPKSTYEQMWKEIRKKDSWQGEITNKKKNGELYEEYLSINAIRDKNGAIESFIGIFSDISLVKQQEKMILQQSRTSAVGEMIGNIAHQWRQPLSVISTASTGMSLQYEMDTPPSKEIALDILEKINNQTQHLSKTIDDFRNFFSGNLSDITEFEVQETIEKVNQLIRDSFENNFIKVDYKIEPKLYLKGNKNLLIQALLNILNNALDILKTSENDKLLIISAFKEDSKTVITITDSGGGIPPKYLEKVFDPYFTTKHKSQGTGIGLYMTHQIIHKQFHGIIDVKNVRFEYNKKKYEGASFSISFDS